MEPVREQWNQSDRMEDVKTSLGGLQQSKNSEDDFEPLVVMEFAVNAKRAAIEWTIAKLQASRQNNGADLSVKAMVMQHNEVNSSSDVSRLFFNGPGIKKIGVFLLLMCVL